MDDVVDIGLQKGMEEQLIEGTLGEKRGAKAAKQDAPLAEVAERENSGAKATGEVESVKEREGEKNSAVERVEEIVGKCEEEPQEVRERILEVAKQLFIENGYKGTSVRDIASESGTNVAMVNYYFRSKYNLFELVFEQTLEMLWFKLLKATDEKKDFMTFIEDWIEVYFEVLTKYPKLPTFLLNEVTINPKQLTERIKQREPYELYLKLSNKIEQEAARGEIRYVPPLDLILNVISMCVFPFILRNFAQPIAGVTNEEYGAMLEEHRKHVISFTMNALKPNPNESEEIP